MKFIKDALGSRLEITIPWDTKNDSAITESFLLVENFEKKYSRFQTWNLLEQINTWSPIEIEPALASMIRLALKLSKLTRGSFDITILPLLENRGYGISEELLPENIGYQSIDLEGNTITLKDGVNIELGSCGKGYMLDCIYKILAKNHKDFVINFWGDIRVSWTKKIFLEDPYNHTKTIGSVELYDRAIASSAGNKRKIWRGHHLVDPQNIQNQDDKIAVYTTHKFWVFADMFATALFVTPLDLSLKILESVEWLEALIIGIDGKIFTSEWFNAQLTF